MFNMTEEKVYFTPGDEVSIKQDVPNKPRMVVASVDKALMRTTAGSKSTLFGVTCFWFDKNQVLREYRFNTKDLVHCE